MDSPKSAPERLATSSSSALPIHESQLRHIVRTEPEFDVLVFPVLDSKTVAWRVVIRIPNHPRDLRLVDLALKDRQWKQLNALMRFVLRSCGDSRKVVVDLTGIKPERLLTRGE